MPQMRTLLFTLASSSVLCPGAAMALGLGEITLYSALNQPLDARIELIDANQLEADEFKVRLASEQAFARAGVERFYVLNDLRFTPVLQGGERYIRVQSNKLMREPYLNFLVEVVRPNGHFVREFTVLFDPPESSAYRQQAAPPDQLGPAYRAACAQPHQRAAGVARRHARRALSGASWRQPVADRQALAAGRQYDFVAAADGRHSCAQSTGFHGRGCLAAESRCRTVAAG